MSNTSILEEAAQIAVSKGEVNASEVQSFAKEILGWGSKYSMLLKEFEPSGRCERYDTQEAWCGAKDLKVIGCVARSHFAKGKRRKFDVKKECPFVGYSADKELVSYKSLYDETTQRYETITGSQQITEDKETEAIGDTEEGSGKSEPADQNENQQQ